MQVILGSNSPRRKEILERTCLRMITEDDFKERVEVEQRILNLETKIKEYKPGKDGYIQGKKVESKKPQTLDVSEV